MTIAARVLLRATVTDDADGEVVMAETIAASIADVVGTAGKRETVALTAAFTALSPPTGSAAVMIRVVSGAVTITLKGVTGDTGVVLQSGTLTTIPLLLPLGTTPSIGLLSSGTAVVECIWL
jgi:hypothetical protein